MILAQDDAADHIGDRSTALRHNERKGDIIGPLRQQSRGSEIVINLVTLRKLI
jgi:hypothetical protein